MCLLVREDEIDLTSTGVHIGEIYFRMIRCLYKKFAIRKGIEFDENCFSLYRQVSFQHPVVWESFTQAN